MKQLNLKSKEFETKKRRFEELSGKDTIKREDIAELTELTGFISQYKDQWYKAEKEYETFLKSEEKQRRIQDEVLGNNEMHLAMLLDTLTTENMGRQKTIDFLTLCLTKATSSKRDLPEETVALGDENPFFRLTMQRHEETRQDMDDLEAKEARLNGKMEYIGMRIGQERNLVDGMNYKIQVLNDDIVVSYDSAEDETQTDTDTVSYEECSSL